MYYPARLLETDHPGMKSDHGFGKLPLFDMRKDQADMIGGDRERAQEAGQKGGQASYENGGLTQ